MLATAHTPASALAAAAEHLVAPVAAAGSTASDWFEAHGGDMLTAALILVAAVIINLLVRRSIRLAVDRLVKASEARRERVEQQNVSAQRAEDATAVRQQADDAAAVRQQTAERLRAAALRSERAEQRTRTVGSLLRYVAAITIYTIAALMVLSELGISIAPLIASAGIAGIALGFGAQSLVKDFLSGMFMLMEDQFGVGDVVDLGEASGTVERVTLRVTTLRGVDGTVWYVPNGQIVRVGNQSQRWSRTVLDVEVAYDTDIERATTVIKRAADDFWKEQVTGATVIEEPEVWGVQNVSPIAVVLRLAVKTRPGEQWAAGRALRARLKTAFDEAGIATPSPMPNTWLTGGPTGAGGEDAGAPPPGGAPS